MIGAHAIIAGKVPLAGVAEPAQIARYSPDGQTLLVTSRRGATAMVMDAAFNHRTTLAVGLQPRWTPLFTRGCYSSPARVMGAFT
jgi:hypothetical protein